MSLKTLVPVLVAVIVLTLISLVSYFKYSSRIHLEFEGRNRSYLLHVPVKRDENAWQLIIMLHGYGDHPRLMELYSGMSKKADSDGTIVVYPYGVANSTYPKLSWNGGSCCAAALEENVNDVGFLDAVVDQLSAQFNIDQDHISIAGFSNGAIMAQRYVTETQKTIRSMALVAGAVGGKRTIDKNYFTLPPRTKNIRVMLLHGKLDESIPFAGGLNKEGSATWESFEKAEQYWKPQAIHIVEDRGHVWFGSFLELVLEKKWPGKLSATDAIWKFFKESND